MEVLSPQKYCVRKSQIRKSQKYIVCKSQIRKLPHLRKVGMFANLKNCSLQIC
jgi:hypothetical protein